MAEQLSDGRLSVAAEFLSATGNAKRLMILQHLLDNELAVNAIAERVGLSQSALSQHLAKLRSHQLVTTRRDRQMVYYRCNSERVRTLLRMLTDMFG